MAVDGRKLRDTLRHGSDVYIENVCSPCAKDNKNVEAVKYCVDCDKNICAKCVSDHKRFAIMRGHQIENTPRSQTGQKRPDLPSKRCDKHGGRLIDVYCSDHNAVGCSTCVAVEHSSCSNVKFIPDVAKGIHKSQELRDLERNLNSFKPRINKLKEQKQIHLKQLRDDKENMRTKIKDQRKKINDQLDKMEKALLCDVDTLFDKRLTAISSAIDVINDRKALVENMQKDFKETLQENEADVFIFLKHEQTYLNENTHMLEDLEKVDNSHPIKWYPNPAIGKILLHDSNIFGNISEVSVPKSICHVGDYNLLLEKDPQACKIGGICVGSNGCIFVTDLDNRNLKQMNESYTIQCVVELSGGPSGLCEIDNTRIAVALINDRKIQFVSQDALKPGKSFSVGDRCRDICAKDNLLYVCCGGNAEKREGPGHIEVYNVDGKRMRYIYGDLVFPVTIYPSRNRNSFLCSNRSFSQTKLCVMDMNEQRLYELQLNKIFSPQRIVRIGDGLFCVAGLDSNNIVLVSEDGDLQQELLTEKDGIVKPIAVCFDEKRSRLIISLGNSNAIKVFNLVM